MFPQFLLTMSEQLGGVAGDDNSKIDIVPWQILMLLLIEVQHYYLEIVILQGNWFFAVYMLAENTIYI